MSDDKNDLLENTDLPNEDTTPNDTPTDESIPLVENWNTPIKRVDNNEAVLERLRDKVRDTHTDPIAEMRQLLSAPPLIDEELVEEDRSVPQSLPYSEQDILKNKIELAKLGVSDHDSTIANVYMDPDINTFSEELVTHVKIENDNSTVSHNTSLGDLNPTIEFVDESDMEEENVTPELTQEELTKLTNELKHQEPGETNIPSELKEAITQTKLPPETVYIDNELPDGLYVLNDDKVMSEIVDDLPELTDKAIPNVPEKEEEEKEEDIQTYLKDVPKSTLSMPELNLNIEDTEEDPKAIELTPLLALKDMVDVQEIFVLNSDKATDTFRATDIHVIKDNDMPLPHIVIPNMTTVELQRYQVSTNPTALRDNALKLLPDYNSVQRRITNEGIEALTYALYNPNSYPHKIHIAAEQNNTANNLMLRDNLESARDKFLKDHPDKKWNPSKAVQIKDNEGKHVISDQFADKEVLLEKIEPNGKRTVAKGDAVKVASMLVNGFRKINLFNSGFSTVISSPTLQQLATYYTTITENSKSYGYDLGQLACLPAGVESRSALLDLWESCIIATNLDKHSEDNNLRKALSVLDIPVIAWALASLMYPKGTDVEYVCYNNNHTVDGKESLCRFTEKVRVSINDMRYNDWTKLSAEAVKFTDSKAIRTVEDCHNYRVTHLKDHGSSYVVNNNVTESIWKAVFKIPSAYDSENVHRTYIANMLTELASGNLENRKEIDSYVRTKYLMTLSPYISSISHTDTTSQKTLEFVGDAALEPVLDQLQLLDDVSISQKLMEYIGSKGISHICFSHHTCPKCKKPPVDAVDGLIAFDPEYSFFVWVTARLLR